MSIASELTRLQNAKNAITSAIAEKGVTVPTGTKLDGMASLIGQIEQGSKPELISGYLSSAAYGTTIYYMDENGYHKLEDMSGTKITCLKNSIAISAGHPYEYAEWMSMMAGTTLEVYYYEEYSAATGSYDKYAAILVRPEMDGFALVLM